MSTAELSQAVDRSLVRSDEGEWLESLVTECAASSGSISGVHLRWLDSEPGAWLEPPCTEEAEDTMRPKTVADALMRRAALIFAPSWQACFVQLAPHGSGRENCAAWSLVATRGTVPPEVIGLRLVDPPNVARHTRLVIPLVHVGRTLGVWLVGTQPGAPLDRNAERLLRKMARQAAAPLEVAVLRAQLARYQRSAPDKAVFSDGLLTEREAQVAAFLVSGMTNLQIANALEVKEGTVAKHVEHILSKLDFQSRSQIAVWAVQRGLGRRED